ncbi:MAG: class I SAM-dependent methyltransferase [Bacteroidia bacterium]|nr:class I SAM-dependent methyltransferase [Bacteroidia bacterium]
MTWEEAVQELRSNPANKQAILDNYFDADVEIANERFARSEEFTELLKYIPKHAKTILDIGAGRGMATYGFAKNGLLATALEPDSSNDVGAGAIRNLALKHNLPITVVETFGESLPFDDHSFDVVYVRQVLHHANDLAKFCKEVQRVLKPNGVFIATREHVLSNEQDLQTFLNNHPLHHLYGGEHAFTLAFYCKCIEESGMKLTKIIHPYESVINFAPLSKNEMRDNFAKSISKLTGMSLAKFIVSNNFIYKKLVDIKASKDNTPGRVYSFIASK